MNHSQQLRITDVRRPDCIFVPRLEDDDFHCNAAGLNTQGYDLIGEDSDDLALRLAEVNGIDFDDIAITNPFNPSLPRYLPTIPSGSGKLFREYTPEYVALSLKDVVSAKELRVATDIHTRLGVPKKTKVILLSFGKDKLLEQVWPAKDRHKIIDEIAKLDLYAVVPPDYSVWGNQPHAERLINQKKSMIIYKELMEAGVSAIPHISWYGKKDLDENIRFLRRHPGIKTVAMDLQTLTGPDWQRAVIDLTYLAAQLGSDMQYMVVGPSVPSRIEQIIRSLPNVTIINSIAAQKAVRKHVLADNLSSSLILRVDKTDLMRTNDFMIKNVADNAFESKLSSHAIDTAARKFRLLGS